MCLVSRAAGNARRDQEFMHSGMNDLSAFAIHSVNRQRNLKFNFHRTYDVHYLMFSGIAQSSQNGSMSRFLRNRLYHGKVTCLHRDF